MRVTELLMRPGGWSMSLRPEAPQSIVQAIRDALATYDSTNERWASVMDGQIVVFDTDVRTPSLERARYVGILDAQSGDRSFSGPGIAAYLQTDDGLGALIDTATDVDAPDSIVAMFINMIAFYGSGNGLIQGTEYTAEAQVAGQWSTPPLGTREMFDSIRAKRWPLHEWRANPDGTVDSGHPDDGLFVTDPTVLVDAQPGGQFGAIRRINGSATSVVIDCAQVTSETSAYPSDPTNPTTVAAAGTVARGLLGDPWIRTRAIDSPGELESDATNIAQYTQDLFEYPRSSFDVASGDQYVRRYVQPGDTVYVHFPEAGIKSDNALSIGARTIFPQKVRVHEIDWGVHEGHGVYLRRHDGSTETWLRLTPYVQFADSSSTWRVGTARGVLDKTALGGAARLGLESDLYASESSTLSTLSTSYLPATPAPMSINAPATPSAPAVRAPTPYAPARRG